MKAVFDRLLSANDIQPVLIDIGASGAAPSIWDPIAKHSTFIGFDPDLRDLREVKDGKYLKAVTVPEAVVANDTGGEVTFYLTRSPYCSSTLPPDSRALADHIFADLFIVEREAKVRASRLDAVLDRLSIKGIDWFKVDSQGTDLQLFNSLRDEVRSKVLAVDIEPGLIDAYVGEDYFIDAHRNLTSNGFWLSNLNVCGTVRMRKSTQAEVSEAHSDLPYPVLERAVRPSPGWCEARYFRTLDWLADHEAPPRDYVLLWVFSMLDGQWGFALDLAAEGRRRFEKEADWSTMKTEALAPIQSQARQDRKSAVISFPRRIARRILGRFRS